MKKLLLASIISSLLLTACDDKPSAEATKQAAQTAEKTAEAPKKATKTDVSPADQAEAMFKELSQGGQKYYQTFVGAHPIVDSMSYEVVSYEKGQDSAVAITKGIINLKVALKGKKTFGLNLKHELTYDAATLASGLVAKINSTVEKPEGLDADEQKAFAEFEKHFAYTTEIHSDQTINQNIVIKPFTVNAKDNDSSNEATSDNSDEISTFTFNGLDINSKSSLKDIAGGFGQFVVEFKGASDSNGFAFGPAGLKGEYLSNGDFVANSTAPWVIKSEGNTFKIESLSAKGNMKLNEKYYLMLGKANYEMKNVQISGNNTPEPVTLTSILVNADNALSDQELISQKADIKITPEAGLVSKLSRGMVDVSEANIGFSMDNIPATAKAQYDELISSTLEHDTEGEIEVNPEELNAKLQPLFESVKKAGSKFDLNIGLTTTDGNISLASKTQLKPESTVTFAELEQMESPEVLLQLLDLNINASVPAKLLEMAAGENIMMVGMFMQKDGEVYKSEITNKEGKLLINGMPAPF